MSRASASIEMPGRLSNEFGSTPKRGSVCGWPSILRGFVPSRPGPEPSLAFFD